MSRRKKRKAPHTTPPSQRNGNGQGRADLFTEPPPPPSMSDSTRVWVTGGPDGPAPETKGNGSAYQEQGTNDKGHPGEEDGADQAGFGSRGNRLGDGLRSRLLFPDHMKKLIDKRARAFTVQLVPRSLFERWAVRQIAIGTVQSDLAGDQLLVNTSLAIQRVDTPRWAEDRRESAEKLGARISTAPSRIAAQLGRSKYGALYLIDRLTCLRESIASNGSLDDPQMACLFDHLGVDHVFRNGSQKVPAGDNGPGLAAAVDKEKARLTTKLERELNALDLDEQASARLGIVRISDQETRNVRGAQTRADRRVKWAYKVLAEVRAGVDPATIIDNETGRPINPVEPDSPIPTPTPAPAPATAPAAAPVREAAPAAEAAPSPSSAPTASVSAAVRVPASVRLRPILEGLPEELRQMVLLADEAVHRESESSDYELMGEAWAGPPG